MEKKITPQRVIWITTDHMRYDCIGAHGNNEIHTPVLDKLVNEGVSFDQCYAQNPLCMPSRCSFMTGLYPQETGVVDNGQSLPADFYPTVAKLFRNIDYQTAQIGKLHFQSHEDCDLDPRARNDYGFDVFWLAEEPGPYEDAYVKWLRSEFPDFERTLRVSRSSSPQRVHEKEGEILDVPWQASFSGWVGTQTERYLTSWGGRQDKQFIHMGFYAPHPPLNPTREMFEPYIDSDITLPESETNQSDDKPYPMSKMLNHLSDWTMEKFEQYRRHFYAMVTGVDMAIGHLIDELEDKVMLDDTLLIFSSDHGDMCGDHRMTGKNHSFFDEIMHLPLVMYWPSGFGKNGMRVKGLTEMVDLLPTVLGLCGSDIPETMSGRDYSTSLLAGEEPNTRDEVMAVHGVENYMMIRTSNYKYIRYSENQEVLFDLVSDPGEIINRVVDQKYISALEDMRRRCRARKIPMRQPLLRKIYKF